MIQVFVAHAKGDSQQRIQGALDLLRGLSAQPFEVTLGYTEWEKSFRRCGTWEAWAEYVATAKRYGSSSPLYDMFVCIDDVAGAATENIVRAALKAGKYVCKLDTNGMHTVVGLYGLGLDDYTQAAKLVYK